MLFDKSECLYAAFSQSAATCSPGPTAQSIGATKCDIEHSRGSRAAGPGLLLGAVIFHQVKCDEREATGLANESDTANLGMQPSHV